MIPIYIDRRESKAVKLRDLIESSSCNSGDTGFCRCHSVVGVMNFLIIRGACGARFEFRDDAARRGAAWRVWPQKL